MAVDFKHKDDSFGGDERGNIAKEKLKQSLLAQYRGIQIIETNKNLDVRGMDIVTVSINGQACTYECASCQDPTIVRGMVIGQTFLKIPVWYIKNKVKNVYDSIAEKWAFYTPLRDASSFLIFNLVDLRQVVKQKLGCEPPFDFSKWDEERVPTLNKGEAVYYGLLYERPRNSTNRSDLFLYVPFKDVLPLATILPIPAC